jgi:hypothetical protein
MWYAFSGFAWRSHVMAEGRKRGARRSPKGEDGLRPHGSPR